MGDDMGERGTTQRGGRGGDTEERRGTEGADKDPQR